MQSMGGTQAIDNFERRNLRTRSQSNYDALRNRIDALAAETSEPDWDCERAPSIPAQDWDAAAKLCIAILDKLLPPPFISPCGDGTIHLSIQHLGKEALIELNGNQMRITFYDANHRMIDSTGIIALDITDCLNRLQDGFTTKSIY